MLSFNVIDPQTPAKVKYDIFRRLNTGGKELNRQEIRNCFEGPEIRKFIGKLAKAEEFLTATRKSISSTRMADREIALRFIAFYLKDQGLNETYKGDMDDYLDKTVELLNRFPQAKLDEIERAFCDAMENAFLLFGENAFRKAKLINKALFLSWSRVLCQYRPEDIQALDLQPGEPFEALQKVIQTNPEYRDALSKGANDARNEEAPFHLYCETENPFPDLGSSRLIPPPDSACDRNLYQTAFYYINAERLGSRNFQNIGDAGNAGESFCGYHGEYVFDVMTRFLNQRVPEERRLETKETLAPFKSQLECWMGYIIPGIHFLAERNVQNRIANLSVRQDDLNTEFASPHNFGFGISYLLPIIVTGLLAQPDSIFIVENPEAHLHPCGQSHIGRFLAQVAFSGVQVIVETHSEHVMNGIRLHALKHRISPDKICINNFAIADGKPYVKRVPLNEYMDILEWPEGFYDQEERDLAEMRHLRMKR